MYTRNGRLPKGALTTAAIARATSAASASGGSSEATPIARSRVEAERDARELQNGSGLGRAEQGAHKAHWRGCSNNAIVTTFAPFH